MTQPSEPAAARSRRFFVTATPEMARGFKRGATFGLLTTSDGVVPSETWTITRRGGWRNGRLTLWAKRTA